MRTGTNFVWQSSTLSTHRGVRRWESSCKSSYSVVSAVHALPSYPLAYSLIVIPLSISIYHKSVPSAAIFLGDIMFNFSGAVNVLLFLIVRPHLLFTPPEELVEPEIELANPRTSTCLFPDLYKHTPQPTGAGLMNDI
jgi:hypothetical protein